jgi:polyhydroxyalkanoate synthase
MGKDAKEHAGSWWPYWREWLQARSGEKVAAPKSLGSKKNRASDPAPGVYVLE